MEDIVVTLFTSPTCPNCPKAKEVCKEVCEEMGIPLVEVDITKEPETALMFQVASTPSIAIGEETVFFGRAPTKQELIEAIERAKD